MYVFVVYIYIYIYICTYVLIFLQGLEAFDCRSMGFTIYRFCAVGKPGDSDEAVKKEKYPAMRDHYSVHPCKTRILKSQIRGMYLRSNKGFRWRALVLICSSSPRFRGAVMRATFPKQKLDS